MVKPTDCLLFFEIFRLSRNPKKMSQKTPGTWIGFTLLLQGKKTSSMSWPRCWVPLQWTSWQWQSSYPAEPLEGWKNIDVDSRMCGWDHEISSLSHLGKLHNTWGKKTIKNMKETSRPTVSYQNLQFAGLVAGADKTWIQAALQHCLRLTIS